MAGPATAIHGFLVSRVDRWMVPYARSSVAWRRLSTSKTRSRAILDGYVGRVLIRPATDGDWPAIWPFFDEIVRAGETYAYAEDLESEGARSLWMESPPGLTVVADDDGTVIGSAKMGPNRQGRGAHVATASFMVDPRFRGRGAGRALGGFVMQWARTAGYHAIQFNAVVETNAAAVALWESLGFEILATVPEAFDHPRQGLVGLHLMYQRL
jgi:L-amino acid N-acyltransferase YncA